MFVKMFFLMKPIYSLLLMLVFSFCFSQENYYPGAKSGMKRVDVDLPKVSKDEKYKVEFFLTLDKEMEDCDVGKMSNKFQKRSYGSNTYYEASSSFDIKIYRDEKCGGKKMTKKVYNEPLMEDYKSNKKFVFYLPENMSIEYRLWKGDGDFIKAK